MQISAAIAETLKSVPAEGPVLIAGPTASGKSALALEIAARTGGVIINADASQVYDCWRIITARPPPEEEAQAPHALYGHVSAEQRYSTGHWLREVVPFLKEDGPRPIVVGGTGLYFKALTQGLAEIPATPPPIRTQGDGLPLAAMLEALDAETRTRIDPLNRARVQRAWEVLQATGRGLAAWHDETAPPALPQGRHHAIVFDVARDWLNARIEQRFDQMLAGGALTEIAAQQAAYDPTRPAHRAIGVPELMAHLAGELSLAQAKEAAVIATRRFAKRQRTWMRSKMADWHKLTLG